MNAPSAALFPSGTAVAVNRGSFEHPQAKVAAVYLGNSSDLRFHWVQVGAELLRVHEHQISQPAPEVVPPSFSNPTDKPAFPKGRWTHD